MEKQKKIQNRRNSQKNQQKIGKYPKNSWWIDDHRTNTDEEKVEKIQKMKKWRKTKNIDWLIASSYSYKFIYKYILSYFYVIRNISLESV